MTEREKLIEELKNRFMPDGVPGFTYTEPVCRVDALADFILADRKRIVEPLVKFKKIENEEEQRTKDRICEAMAQTLKNAGVE